MTTATTTGPATSAEVSSAITSGMSFVYDLYGEMGSFFQLLTDQLEASELAIGPPINKRFLLPRTRAERGLVHFLMRTEVGLLAELNAGAGEDVDELDDDEDVDDEEETQPTKNRKLFHVTPETQFVAVRSILFDPKRAKDSEFRPTVVAATLSSLRRTWVMRKKSKSTPAKGSEKVDKFSLRPAALPRLVRALDPDSSTGSQISCRIPKYQLSATVAAIVSRELAQFDSEDSVESFVRELSEQVEPTAS